MNSFCPDCGNALVEKTVEERSRSYCEECDQIIWRNPKPVAWVLARVDEEYLLVKRAEQPDRGEWDIPGGFLEIDESFREAAIRELREETGVEVDPGELEILDTVSFHRHDNYVVGVVYHTETSDINPEAGDDAQEARLWNLHQLENSTETLRNVCRKQVLEQLD